MKKLLSAFLIASLLLTGCSSEDDSKEAKNEDSTEEVENTEDDSSQETSSKDQDATIEETVIYDANNIKVTATELDEDLFYGTTIKINVENNGDSNIIVSADSMSVNDLMIESQLWTEVAAGKKANDEIIMLNLEESDITTIAKIEFNLKILSEDWNEIDSSYITLNTSAADYVQNYDTSGVLAVDQNGVKIYVKKVNTTDSFWGADVYVYIENNSGQQICVQAENVSINGYMVEPVFSCDVLDGKKANDTITFMESDLEDNDIEDIDTIELTFKCFNWDTYSDIFTTDPITVNFE